MMVEKRQKTSKTSTGTVRTPRMRKLGEVEGAPRRTLGELSGTSRGGAKKNNAGRGKHREIVISLVVLVVMAAVIVVVALLTSDKGRGGGNESAKQSTSEIEEAYNACTRWPNTDENYMKLIGDDLILVRIMTDDMNALKGAMHCAIDRLGGVTEFNDELDKMNIYTMGGFDFGGYRGVMKMQMIDDTLDNMAFYLAIFETGADRLATAAEVCNTIFVDRGEPVKSRYSYESYDAYREAEKAYKSYGTIRLGDGGKTLFYRRQSGEYTDNKNCVYEVVELPERIQTAMRNTSKGTTRKEEWDDFVVEWGPGEDDFMIYRY